MKKIKISGNGLGVAWPMVLVLLLCTSHSLSAGEPVSDDEKKTIVYGMYARYKKKFPAVRDIHPKAAMDLTQKGGAVFVDIRRPAEMTVSALPGAITRETFLEDPSRYAGMTVIAYCTISYRSGVFAKEMAEQGIEVENLTGGILAWTLEGGKVYDENGEVRRIHVYGRDWNYPPEGYEAVMFGPLNKLVRP